MKPEVLRLTACPTKKVRSYNVTQRVHSIVLRYSFYPHLCKKTKLHVTNTHTHTLEEGGIWRADTSGMFGTFRLQLLRKVQTTGLFCSTLFLFSPHYTNFPINTLPSLLHRQPQAAFYFQTTPASRGRKTCLKIINFILVVEVTVFYSAIHHNIFNNGWTLFHLGV